MSLKSILISIVALLTFIPAFCQLDGYSLDYILVDPDAENPIEAITPYSPDDFSRENTLDIVTWNVSWMGAPAMNSYKYGDRMEQISGIAQKLVDQDADVFALQEVIVNAEGNALNDLLAEMNSLAGEEMYSGVYSEYHSLYWKEEDPDFPPQCLAFVWNTQTVTVNQDSALLQDESTYSDFGAGRLPYLLDANVTLNGKTQRYMFINLHLKAMSGESDRRATSMTLLKKLLDINFTTNNVVITGDLNVVDASGAIGEISDWGMYNDVNEDGITDYVHAGGDANSGIEHTLISDELFDELAYLPSMYRNMTISGTGIKLSDHYAYETSLYIYEESGNFPPEDNSLTNHSASSFTMEKADYQVIVDYVKNDPTISELDNSTYDDSEYYFGASTYYQNFDIRDDKHDSSFASWEDAVKTAISTALLPQLFPNASVSDPLYAVTFNTYNGDNVSYTFYFKCTKSTPDPEFEYTDDTSSSSESLSNSHVPDVYPNPAANVLYISTEESILSVQIYDQTGRLVLTETQLIELNEVDISSLKNGLYFVKIQTSDSKYSFKVAKKSL